jgi:hypothetical protein
MPDKNVQHAYVDQSPLVARRLGFATLPLAVLAILIGGQLSRLLFALGADGAEFEGETPADNLRYAKWCVLGTLFWLWSVQALLYADRRENLRHVAARLCSRSSSALTSFNLRRTDRRAWMRGHGRMPLTTSAGTQLARAWRRGWDLPASRPFFY